VMVKPRFHHLAASVAAPDQPGQTRAKPRCAFRGRDTFGPAPPNEKHCAEDQLADHL